MSIVDGVLVIGAVQKVHESEYTCTATNDAGTDSLRTIIYVSEGQPRPPRGDDRRDYQRGSSRDDQRDDGVRKRMVAPRILLSQPNTYR